ncbi:SDR family NAD(P)-dependent oxidoreductase [Aeromicrobium wangtongii]|uniref:SDR family oxidoreductase n=1 Tax=Aeromicrobium wangtongii TaxID=2969247 RepID=A0ABY5MEJ9_9ACTN|nr:SDR family oxidoreductase [Aeromicrobium wangtongii]MCD9197677.1 SDR family oxidoreductase [Aeromicrobium wangtongii]UUP15162.1 SDR family oxidoreductase [Aeromicrobium wangtongii]
MNIEVGVAVVTGAGRERGIGRAIALRLACDGFAVVVHERSGERSSLLPAEQANGWRGAASVVDEIEAQGGRALASRGDLTERATAEQLNAVAGELGPLAVLVNNHGSAGEANTYMAHETPDDLWDRTVMTNLTSLHRLTSVLVPTMAASSAPRRSIVHLSSTAGHRVLGRYAAYCASKGAVERLTEQQALELARHQIRVNCVAPGMTPTDMIDGTLARAAAAANVDVETIQKSALRGIPLRRLAAASDIAGAVSFLVGPDAGFVTGQILTVDGGMSL